jgi:hypothetical protein
MSNFVLEAKLATANALRARESREHSELISKLHGVLAEVRAENTALRGLLLSSVCPDCGNAGYYVIEENGICEQVQCQWCFERSSILTKEDGK